MNTVPRLQLVQFIEGAIRESEPDIIITHHPADTNNDHLQTSMAVVRTFNTLMGSCRRELAEELEQWNLVRLTRDDNEGGR